MEYLTWNVRIYHAHGMKLSYTFNLDRLSTRTHHFGLVFQIYIGISGYKSHKKAGLQHCLKILFWKHYRGGIPSSSLLRVNIIEKYYCGTLFHRQVAWFCFDIYYRQRYLNFSYKICLFQISYWSGWGLIRSCYKFNAVWIRMSPHTLSLTKLVDIKYKYLY